MPTAAPGPSDALASVISLDASRRTPPPAEAAPAPGAPSAPDDAELARALAALRRHVGERGLELPPDLGRRLAHIERLLAETPTALDTGRVLPALAAEVGALAAAAGRVTLDLVPEEAEVLSAALGAPLDRLPLGALHEVADAVLAVSRAPQGAARWGDPRAAQAAEAVLTVAAGDLREAARTHEWLYAHFTDLVWEVPPQLLERASSRWRVAARGRLRRILRLASRTGRLPGGVAAAAEGVSAARGARTRVGAVAPLLSQHLG